MNQTYWLGVVFTGIVLIAIFLSLRNSGMKQRYATWWIVIAIASAVFSVFPAALHGVSHMLGIVVPLNFAFFAAGIVLLLLSLRYSIDLSKAGEERRRLVEEIALLNARIDELETRSETTRSED